MGSLLAQQSNRTNIGKLQKICLGSAAKSNLKRYGQGRKKWGRTFILAFAKHIGVIHKTVVANWVKSLFLTLECRCTATAG
jgi:hypothetical protein